MFLNPLPNKETEDYTGKFDKELNGSWAATSILKKTLRNAIISSTQWDKKCSQINRIVKACHTWPWPGKGSHRRWCRSKWIWSEIERKLEMIASNNSSQDLSHRSTVPLASVSKTRAVWGDHGIHCKAATRMKDESSVFSCRDEIKKMGPRCENLLAALDLLPVIFVL